MTINILQGNALAVPLADGCVQTVVTSPPYWGLRDYGVPGQLGLEATPDEYVANMVKVFREVGRVLRDDGTLWLNLGDSYATGGDRQTGRNDTDRETPGGRGGSFRGGGRTVTEQRDGLKQKDLVGIPWRVAFALQADGWYLRSDIIWHKPNPMPESVTDRPTKAHEYIFLLSKSARYYYDAEAVKEAAAGDWHGSSFTNERDLAVRPTTGMKPRGGGFSRKYAEQQPAHGAMALERPADNGTRNRRTVWTIATAPYSGAHFATFPPKLVEPCILAGTSERGACPHCGAPWARVVEQGLTAHDGETASTYAEGTTANRLALLRQAARERGEEYTSAKKTLGWSPTCACPPHEPRPCLVLDPFSGSGTVGKVAVQHRRRFVGTELSAAYIKLAEERTGRVQVEMAL